MTEKRKQSNFYREHVQKRWDISSDLIKKDLLDKRFLKENHLDKGHVNDILESAGWLNVLKTLDEALGFDGRFDAVKVGNILSDNIDIFKEEPGMGWAEYCYKYTLNKLFPHLNMDLVEDFNIQKVLFFQIVKSLYKQERKNLPFNPAYDYELLTDHEMEHRDITPEYNTFRKFISGKYIYEFMRMGADITPFNTVGHIGGVHYIAMLVARQLNKSGLPVDLGLVSGAAIGHDLGKYGCKKSEEKRVPYLHYYYTDKCLNDFGMPTIAHIAGNHSTWDLELENLSVESLILIYSDFRVRGERNGQTGKEEVKFFSLDSAYQVILNKLDNVDEAKKKRYERVYSKLKDFEDYMKERGVNVEIPSDFSSYEDREVCSHKRDVVLLYGNDVCKQFKFKAIEYNLRMMRGFHPNKEFGTIIEAARSERKWKNLRTYISIFADYSKYMVGKQKAMTLNFLYEMLLHKEGDIRNQAAEAMGRIIANFSEEFKKELPEGIAPFDSVAENVHYFKQYAEMILEPDHKYTDQHKKWILNCFDNFVISALNCGGENLRKRYLDIIIEYLNRYDYGVEKSLVFLKAIKQIDSKYCSDEFIKAAQKFLSKMAMKEDVGIRIASIEAASGFLNRFKEDWYYKSIGKILGIPYKSHELTKYLGNMFLEDLKAGTPWTIKSANISFMVKAAKSGMESGYLLHIATHLANLIKVSETIVVRKKAGEGLLEMVSMMPAEQINEIAVELFNGLENDDYQYSKYIPEYLGRILLNLPPSELDEFILDMVKALDREGEKTASAIIDTFGIMVSHYSKYKALYGESEETYSNRRNRIINILIKAFAGYKDVIYKEAFWVIGTDIFQSSVLSLKEKADIFVTFSKKILAILWEKEERELDFFTNAAVLNRIYKFIGVHHSKYGKFRHNEPDKVVFFPGTFDPFSLGHKAIATTIRDMGMEVFLALDEFSWSKKTQPRLERRKIMMMSVGGEDNVYLFPDDIPINIANPKDIKRLKELFDGKELYIAVGSDVIKNASSYRGEPGENTIHSLNHIVFARENQGKVPKGYRTKGNKGYPITGKVIRLKMPKMYREISSTVIREHIDSNRDIANLIDVVAQNYIYDNNLYLREPEYKHILEAKELYIGRYGKIPEHCIYSMEKEILRSGYDINKVKDYIKRDDIKGVYLESGGKNKRVIAMATVHRVDSDKLIDEFKDLSLSVKIREAAQGRIASIGLMVTRKTGAISNINQYLVTEILTALIARDYAYAVYNPIDEGRDNHKFVDVLKKQGFVNIANSGEKPIYAVDMKAPVIIFKDVEKNIKAPLNKNAEVLKVVENCHNRLLNTLTGIYEGKLIISFNTSALYSKIMHKVAELNGVATVTDKNGVRGPYMSVPFGDALIGVAVPNTVTKALHTEKYFNKNITGFTIAERKSYSDIDNQVKTIKSFDRPVILIDDLLHKGYRMQKIKPILSSNNVDVKAIVTGVLTGNAKDFMKLHGMDVYSAYYMPSIQLWLNEKDGYPFIGGNSIESNGKNHVNLIMPFAYPAFIKRDDEDAVYRYSMTCLENAFDILQVLEREYQKIFEKKLTMKRLGEVITSPKNQDEGLGVEMDGNMAPSQFIRNSITRLIRLGTGRQKRRVELEEAEYGR